MSEQTAETVANILSLATLAATGLVLFRLIAGPDGSRRVVMRAARGAESFCNSQAIMWAHLADSAESVYNKARHVSV